jgi:hypothetical protein
MALLLQFHEKSQGKTVWSLGPWIAVVEDPKKCWWGPQEILLGWNLEKMILISISFTLKKKFNYIFLSKKVKHEYTFTLRTAKKYA